MQMIQQMNQQLQKLLSNKTPANVILDEKGRLLGSDGNPVPLVVPMPREEKQNFVQEIKDTLKPVLTQLTEKLISNAMEPFKRTVRKLE